MAAVIAIFDNKSTNLIIGHSTANNKENEKSNEVQSQEEPLYAKRMVKEIGKSITFLGANVCTISEKQLERRIKLKGIIGEKQPEIVIFVETNLQSDWNPYPQIYADFRTENHKNCGVFMLIKKDLVPYLITKWENKGLCVFVEKLGLHVIGIYTPYYDDFENGMNMLKNLTENKKWIAFGDHEHMIKRFANFGDFKYIPEFSREVKGAKSVTDGFYGNLSIKEGKIEHKISYHHILTCKVEQGYGVIKKSQSKYKRS